MECGRILKDLLYGDLADGSRLTERPRLQFKAVCERDLKKCNIHISGWEGSAEDRSLWQRNVALKTDIVVGLQSTTIVLMAGNAEPT
ncbi:hypothetical protein Pmani_027980 [Petrolisthes manimaculis]|uniref:Uncharacterized protein n=1 Tax=Petrolisthes manimaculis TaxID=1843537 RepID=A0AAE1P0B4_9EUCA|nr:hypothetical protein Pmani_027980 [Petrolisthes manimaculis]